MGTWVVSSWERDTWGRAVTVFICHHMSPHVITCQRFTDSLTLDIETPRHLRHNNLTLRFLTTVTCQHSDIVTPQHDDTPTLRHPNISDILTTKKNDIPLPMTFCHPDSLTLRHFSAYTFWHFLPLKHFATRTIHQLDIFTLFYYYYHNFFVVAIITYNG